MSDSKIQDLEKSLTLKIQEIDSLKAQNGRLIEKLQEEIDKSSSSTIQKEIVHKEILQIHMTLREVYQQGQLKKSVLEKMFNKINDLENKLQDQQKSAATNYGKYVTAAVNDEMEALKLDLLKIQSKEISIEKLLLDTNTELQEQKQQIKATQLAVNAILKQVLKQDTIATANSIAQAVANSEKPAPVASATTSALVTPVSSDTRATASDMEKISLELRNELSNNKEDLNLILQLINEKNADQ